MERKIRITEASLLFNVGASPRMPVNSSVPFVVDTRGEDIERAVSASVGAKNLPDWLVRCKKTRGNLAFTYASELQNVDCIFREQRFTLSIRGIRYNNLEKFVHNHMDKIFDILDTGPLESPLITYKAYMALYVGEPWNRDVVADTITNDPDISQVAAVSEAAYTLNNRSLFSVSVLVPASGAYARATLRHDDLDGSMALVTMSKLPDVLASEHVADVICRALTARYVLHGRDVATPHRDPNYITHLRNELPELFIHNYTRECRVLPIMVSEELAETLIDTRRVIFYPLDSAMGRYYTAPDGYFVGLKKNRLYNRDTFPCLVTCYLQDHMLRKGSETYMYYAGEEKPKKRARPSRPVPRAIKQDTLVEGYIRRGAASFLGAVEAATKETVDAGFPWCPQVVRQEMCDASDDEIMGEIMNPTCGPQVYRYFEELLCVSIHVVVIDSGRFRLHSGDGYIWAPPYPRHVVIFETVKKAYGETSNQYDMLVAEDGKTMFDGSDPVVSFITRNKGANCIPPQDVGDAVKQLIDHKGRCRMVVNTSGDRVSAFTRPLTVPVMPDPVCFFDVHTRKMNQIKQAMGLRATDPYKRSNKSTLYFPNDMSFKHWVEKVAT